MAHNEWCLKPGESLAPNQWLRSKNGLFTALMQDDSNFCIYRGDYSHSKYNTCLWSTVTDDAKGKPYAGIEPCTIIMQDDGNLAIYGKGGPVWAITTHHKPTLMPGSWACLHDDGHFGVAPGGNWSQRVWSTNATDTIESFKLKDLIYDLKNVRIKPVGGLVQSVSEIAKNNTSVPQDATLTMTYTKSKSTGWKTSTTLKVGTKTTFKSGIPSLAEGKVEVSAEFTQSFEWNETTTETNAVAVSLKVNVPPGKKIIGRCTWHESEVSIPFTVVGTGKFNKFEHEIPIFFEGVYEGAQSHDVETSWSELTDGSPNLRFWMGAAKAMVAE